MPKISDLVGKGENDEPEGTMGQTLRASYGVSDAWGKMEGERLRREAEQAQAPLDIRDVLIHMNSQISDLRTEQAAADAGSRRRDVLMILLTAAILVLTALLVYDVFVR